MSPYLWCQIALVIDRVHSCGVKYWLAYVRPRLLASNACLYTTYNFSKSNLFRATMFFMGLREALFLSWILSSGCLELTSREPPTVNIKTHISNICNVVVILSLFHGTRIFYIVAFNETLVCLMASYETRGFFHYRIKLMLPLNFIRYFEATCFFF